MLRLSNILSEDLRKWFGKGPTGGWDRYNSKGEKAGKCGDSEEGSKYAACLSNEKAAKLGKDGRASFVKRKRAAQSDAGDSKKGGEQKKGQKPTLVKTGASEDINEAGMNPVKKVVNAILKKHNIQAMKTYASSVGGAHNMTRGGYRYEGDYFLGFYGNIPQDVIEKIGAEMKKVGVKGVDVRKGIISADFTKTGLNEVKLNDLVNTRFSIEVGSGKTTGNWSNEELIEKLKEAIKHNLFDREFYYNWTDLGKEYNSIFEKETLSPMIKNIDRTLKEFFVLKGSTLVFRLEGSNAQKWIDKWFQTNKSISNELKSDYYSYRKKYAGVTLRESVNEDWSEKYKNSIDCNNPKGFSQKAHCAGKNESMNLEEKLNLFLEKNVPTDPQKWTASIAAAKKKFDVYPSAYANGWAAKNYKEKGGGWKTAK